MKTHGFTLIELLTVMALLTVLAALLLPATIRAYKHSKAWVWGVESFHAARIDAALDERDKALLTLCTNKPKPWSDIPAKLSD